MLWRACQGLRHLYHATLADASTTRPCYSTLLRVPILVQIPLVQRASAHTSHARAVRVYPEPHPEPSVAPATIQTKERPVPRPRQQANPRRTLDQPPRKLVSTVDALFASKEAGTLTVNKLKQETSHLSTLFTNTDELRAAAILMVNTSYPQRSLHLLLLAHDLGQPLRLSLFESVAHQLAETQQWTLIPSVVALAKHIRGRTSVRLLNWYAYAGVKTERFKLLDQVLNAFKEEGFSPSRRTYHILLNGYIRKGDLTKAKECFQLMERDGFPIDVSTHAVIARAYRFLGSDQEVIKDGLDALPKLDGREASTVLNSLLQLKLDAGDLDGAFQYLSRFYGSTTQEHPSNVSGDLITPAVGEEEVPAPDAPPHAITPDAATFTMIINYLAKERNLPLALKMLEQMKLSGIFPDSALAAAVIRVHCAADDLPTALCIAARMCKDLPATQPIFRWLGLKEGHDVDLLPPGIPVTVDVLNALLRAVLKHRGVAGMQRMCRLMRANGLEPNAESVTIFLNHLYKEEEAHPSQLLLVLKALAPTIPPTLEHVRVVFRALYHRDSLRVRRRGWWALRRKVIDKTAIPTKSSRLRVNRRFVASAGLVPGTKTQRRLLRPIMQSLLDRGFRNNREAIALRMQHDAVINRDIWSARDHLQNMLRRGMHATKHHIAALMQGYALRGDMPMVERLYRSMRDADIRPTVVHFTIYIVGYAQLGKPGLALGAFRKMVTAGIQPDKASIDALASAWFAVGVPSVARRVLTELWHHVAPFPEELRTANTATLTTAFRALPDKCFEKKRTRKTDRNLRWRVARLVMLWGRWKNARRLERQRRRKYKVCAPLPVWSD